MKRFLAILLVAATLASFAACSQQNGKEAESPAKSASADMETSQAETPQEELYEVVMEYPTLGQTPRDLKLVEDKVNERTEKEIGVHVTLFPVSAMELNSQTNLMISTGEKLDLACILFEGGIGGYVNKGAFLELDGLVADYGQDIVRVEGIAMAGGYFNNKLYAIVNECYMGQQNGFMARKTIIDKYGIEYDPNHVYNHEELGAIFAEIKAGEASQFYCIAGNSGDVFTSMNGIDTLGGSIGSGVLMNYGRGSTAVVNAFETPEFANACDYARKWYNAGYYSPDCNTTTDSVIDLLQTGNYLGAFNNCVPGVVRDWQGLARVIDGDDGGFLPFYTQAPHTTMQVFQNSMWAVPITCDNPEKTMQWLNLLYADEEMTNLLYLGIQGVHWNFAEGSKRVVERPADYDPADPPYMAVLDVWGDKSVQYVQAPADESYYTDLKNFNDSITDEHKSGVLGYCFNTEVCKAQYVAVADVAAQYQPSLLYGVVDPASVLPEFLSALKAAGIDELIKANQEQLNEWLAEQK
ncbi:MAG: ABC transporter substrate-binding protein [Clostridiales bacterium]|nr:ABC transporter substrate-binding protein [Clostridiales bacterium]